MAAEHILMLSTSGLRIVFSRAGDRLTLLQLEPARAAPLLYQDRLARQAGAGPVGNPLAVRIRDGCFAGLYGADGFRVLQLEHNQQRLLAYLDHPSMPLQLALEVSVDGSVATWSGQALWNGEEDVEAEIYFPLLSRLRFDDLARDRALFTPLSGSVLQPLGEINYRGTYVGNQALPMFMLEGGGHGLAILDGNRADFAADPSACVQRSYLAGNTFPLGERRWWETRGGEDGPFAGVCHLRRFRGTLAYGGRLAHEREGDGRGASGPSDEQLPLRKLGDSADLGPIHTYAYHGSWREGAAWLRDQRQLVTFRQSPADWYRRTTFVSEENGDELVRAKRTFYDLPKVLAERRRLGSDVFHLYGFHDGEVLGSSQNWNNRGDYTFAARNLGGTEAVRRGVEALHRAGGHILYYVEGLIVWKRSRIGRALGQDWAIMKADGSYDEHYQGFWHMCPAHEAWQSWLAATCAEVLRTTGIDGFFIDSLLATHNHRCFNPTHRHPHPDVWNWGVRQLLRRIRMAVDQVEPNTILLVEGCADLARESADGCISHGHDWSLMTLSEPVVRFIDPRMCAFESWRCHPHFPAPPQRQHIWNAVNGCRIYAHNPQRDEMAELSLRTRAYYDLYPEICDNPISRHAPAVEGCIAQLFEGKPPVLTVGNVDQHASSATVTLPLQCSALFDRVDGMRVPVADGTARFSLREWEYRAFEIKP